jgi:hypothetical protein
MERVAFLIESTGERIACLLNPESLTFTRQAGLRTRQGRAGTLIGSAPADDPLIVTGGGVTELALELLFDTELAASLDPGTTLSPDLADALEPAVSTDGSMPTPVEPPDPDVRDLTRPLWNLTEPFTGPGGASEPPLVRFIWGRAWNMPAVVTAVAEKLERFGAGGAPRRSWLTLRLRRVPDTVRPEPSDLTDPLPFTDDAPILWDGLDPELQDATYIEAIADGDGGTVTPLYQLADEHLGSPQSWPVIAAASGIEDPLRIAPGTVLVIPGTNEGHSA